MKLFCALFFAFFCQAAPAATASAAAATPTPPAPAFYVIAARDNGDALLHSSVKSINPKAALPLVVLGKDKIDCCFYFGARKAGIKSSIKVDPDLAPYSSEADEETYQLPGFVKPDVAAVAADKLAFGMEGLSAVRHTGKGSYELTVAGSSSPVTMKHCTGSEGMNFKLYRNARDKKPYASYYYAFGYDVKSDCR